MVHVSEGKDWQDNHDSKISFKALHGLVNRIVDDIPGMDNPPNTMATEFQSLSLVLREQKNGVIFLAKGIHQDDELHYNLLCKAAGGNSEFHIYVKQGLEKKIQTLPVRDTPYMRQLGIAGKVAETSLFQYANGGISWRKHEGSPLLLWPAMFVKNGYPGRVRGNSFSIGNSKATRERAPNYKTETLVDPK